MSANQHSKATNHPRTSGGARPAALSWKALANRLFSLGNAILNDEKKDQKNSGLAPIIFRAAHECDDHSDGSAPATHQPPDTPDPSKIVEMAGECFDQMLLLDSNSDTAWQGKGMVRAKIGTTDEVIDCYTNAVNLNPSNCYCTFNLAFYLRITGRYRESLDAFVSFCAFADPADDYDREKIRQAKLWVRYLKRKIELFGDCR